MSIFVQITSYRSFDLVPTVRDCIEKSKDREGLHFGLCIQQDDEIPRELNHERISVEITPYRQSAGHGSARRRAQQFYSGQDYVLQLDGGCRLAQGWDEILVEAIKLSGSPKPIITNPANKFDPEKNQMENPDVSYKSQCYSFLSEAPSFWPVAMKNIIGLQKSRNISDHFFFAHGSHCVECPYDPELYWSEIESALTVRSFTLGYDIFHHFKPVVFRNYSNRRMNWNDDSEWWTKDKLSKSRFSSLVSGSLSEFGLGTARSTRDFELYSGIDYLGRRIQKDVLSGLEPPCKFTDEKQWESNYMKDHAMLLSWDVSKIEDCDDYDYWLFAIEDQNGAVINRQDIRWERDKAIVEKKVSSKKVYFKSMADKVPSSLLIQPFSKSRGGLAKSKFAI
jgi:hypothetical protein